MRPLPLVLAAAAFLAAAPFAAAAPGAPDTSLGPGGLRLETDILRGIADPGTEFRSLTVLPAGELMVFSRERCGATCDRYLTFARYTPDGAPLGVWRRGSSEDAGGPALVGEPYVTSYGDVLIGYSDWATGSSVLELDAKDGTRIGQSPLPAPLAPAALLPGGAMLASSGRRVVRLTAELAVDPSFGRNGEVLAPAAVGPAPTVTPVGRRFALAGAGPRGNAVATVTRRGVLTRVVRLPVPAWVKRRDGAGVIADVVRRRGGGALVVVNGAYLRTAGTPRSRSYVTALTAAGEIDRRFGRGGVVSLPTTDSAVAVQRDERIVVAGSDRCAGDLQRCRADIMLRRLTPSGRPDASFPARRVRTPAKFFEGFGIAIDRRLRIVFAGGAFTTHGRSGLLLARFFTR